MSYDEKTYLKQYNSNSIDKGLEDWLFGKQEDSYDDNGNKLLYDEFDDSEDIFHNHIKLKRVISKVLNKHSFTNNADWGGADVWGLKTIDNITGLFIYLGDDEDFVLLNRRINEEEDYEDTVLQTITNNIELNVLFLDHINP
nr:hypothetical protein [Tenacibaculum todarodis]